MTDPEKALELAAELEGRYRKPDLDWEARLAHDAARTIRALVAEREEAQAQVARIAAEAKAWADSPRGEIAPTQGVGIHFLSVLAGTRNS